MVFTLIFVHHFLFVNIFIPKTRFYKYSTGGTFLGTISILPSSFTTVFLECCFWIGSSKKHKNKCVNIYGGLQTQTKLYSQFFILITSKISEPTHIMKVELWERNLWGENWLEKSFTIFLIILATLL